MDESALGADCTTVSRISVGTSPSSASSLSPVANEPHLVVQAIIKADLGAGWINHLRAAGGGMPMKWSRVARFLLEGDGHEARAVRDALGDETLVLTDPMELVRSLDMTLLDSGRASAPICGLAMTGSTAQATLSFQLRRWIGLDLLQQSGVGTVAHLISTADRTGWDYLDHTESYGVSVGEMVQRCNGQLRRITKLATQSTALIVHERDPEVTLLDPEPWALPTRFISGVNPFEARMRLKAIGRSNIIFDRDEAPITNMVEEVRLAAEVTGSWSWQLEEMSGGAVRSDDDAHHVRIQLADIAAGFARSLIERDGLLAVATRFRLVLYNGERLTLDEAARLDKVRSTHRGLLTTAWPIAQRG